MQARFTVLGVHPVEADEPCHLVEVLVEGADGELSWPEITQEVEDQPRDNWQAPYDDQVLEEADGKSRYAFFFHYLDFNKPLLTPFGPVRLPKVTKIPNHLRNIQYDAP